MEKIITMENLRNFAYCNSHLLKQPVRGVVVCMFGHGDKRVFREDSDVGNGPLIGPVMPRWGENGILLLVPYYNPWCWMNRQAAAYVDEVMDAAYRALSVPEDAPVVYSGGSMGGLSALAYAVYSRRVPAACVVNCPVCDLPKLMPDYGRSIYSAFASYDGTLQDAMRSVSPIHLVDRMPLRTKYVIFHTEGDPAISILTHSDPFVEKLKHEHDVTYYRVPRRRALRDGGRDVGAVPGVDRTRRGLLMKRPRSSAPLKNPARIGNKLTRIRRTSKMMLTAKRVPQHEAEAENADRRPKREDGIV